MSTLLGKFVSFIRNLLAVFGALCLIFVGLYGVKVYRTSALPPRQFVLKAFNKLGVASPLLEKIISASPRFPDYEFQGHFRSDLFPRTVFGGQVSVTKLRSKYSEDATFKRQVDSVGKSSNPMHCAVAWICSGQSQYQQAGLRALESQNVTSPQEQDGHEGNGWFLAVAYDLLRTSPEHRLPSFEIRLQDYVQKSLLILDEDSASLWHGRFTLASSAWLAASVLDDGSEGARNVLRQAQAQFLQAVLALEVSEGWPEGYTYWINNRAFVYTLAALAHLHGVEEPQLNDRIRRTVERAGLWTIHGTEPAGRFVLFGDTGPRNDLKYDTQRVIDLMFLATDNPVFRGFSEYLSTQFTTETYDPPYRWGIPLFQGTARGSLPAQRSNLDFLDGVLPRAEIFGPDSFGQAFMRSDWGENATFIAFQAGHTFTHHGHYQAGHFTIFKNEPLAITSGTYGAWNSPHRLNYYMRTVASNSLLILRPNEKVQSNKFFESNVADGGQRIVLPTGSAITSVGNWRENLYAGRHYEGGRITAFENREPLFTYVASDLTSAYNSSAFDENGAGGKVSSVIRKLLYLRSEEVLVVFDRVAATEGRFVKKWLLHSFQKPQSSNEKVLVGNADNGILETTDEILTISGRKESLVVRKFLPEDGGVRKVGGGDYRYYVEIDGDETKLDGLNMALGADKKPWFDAGLWRIEIQPKTGRKTDDFLVLLKPGKDGGAFAERCRNLEATEGRGIETPGAVVLFADLQREESIAYRVSDGRRTHIMLGVAPSKTYLIAYGDGEIEAKSSKDGVLTFELEMLTAGTIHINALI